MGFSWRHAGQEAGSDGCVCGGGGSPGGTLVRRQGVTGWGGGFSWRHAGQEAGSDGGGGGFSWRHAGQEAGSDGGGGGGGFSGEVLAGTEIPGGGYTV